MRSVNYLVTVSLFAAASMAAPSGLFAQAVPHLQVAGNTKHLIVDGKPWIALAGEVHNSTASSASYMAPIWDNLAAQNLNTVITPAYWELVEPAEGKFDFSLVDEQLRQARSRKMRIVLLWFGTLKNASSTYAPQWVREDRARFPRAALASETAGGRDLPISIFGPNIVAADAKAFNRLLNHLAQVDQQHTVIAVQVENEAGLLGDSRDRSPVAERAWNGPVSQALMNYLIRNKGRLAPTLDAVWARNGYRRSGNWPQVFGNDWQADEIFMAWGVGRLVNTVAAAGKSQLSLPMYANAWLGPQKPTDQAGRYPSGGPVPRVFDVWRAVAPSLDWLSPDIYVDDFEYWAAAYASPGNPLFVPEAKLNVGNLFLALGKYKAMGFGPFGIEEGAPDNQTAEAYGFLGGMIPQLAEAQSRDLIAGFALKDGETLSRRMGDYVLTVGGQRAFVSKMLLDMGVTIRDAPPERKAQNIGRQATELSDLRPTGLIIQIAPDEFVLVGKDLTVRFAAAATPTQAVEIARIEEGRFVDGAWQPERVLNGDERLSLLPSDSFGSVRIKLLRPRQAS